MTSSLDLIGKTMMTPFEPAGKVKVISVELGTYFGEDLAGIIHIEDHPMGYKKDSYGCYLAKELRFLPSEKSDDD